MRFLGAIKYSDINEQNCSPLERYNLVLQSICFCSDIWCS